jgi:hypothetical protein
VSPFNEEVISPKSIFRDKYWEVKGLVLQIFISGKIVEAFRWKTEALHRMNDIYL